MFPEPLSSIYRSGVPSVPDKRDETVLLDAAHRMLWLVFSYVSKTSKQVLLMLGWVETNCNILY